MSCPTDGLRDYGGIMGAVLLSPIYILLNIYLVWRLHLWLCALSGLFGSLWVLVPGIICYFLLALSPLPAAFACGRLKLWSKRISNYWLGALMYLLIFLLLTDLILILAALIRRQSILTAILSRYDWRRGILILSATTVLCIYGIFHATRIKISHYEAVIHKKSPLPGLRIALVADLHIGYSVRLRHIHRICNSIRQINPDLIVFAGDIFDNEYDAIDQPRKMATLLSGLKSTYGSYACPGNHDIEELILAGFTFHSDCPDAVISPRMRTFLQDAGIRLLEDETVLIDNSFLLCGRLDASCKIKSGTIRLTPSELISGLDSSKPIIIIDHQPSELRELSAAGADLVLSGHTHDGQIFPGSLTTRLGWMNSCGKLILGRMTSIVTSGAGIWGPAMRVGTDNEVADILVKFDP